MLVFSNPPRRTGRRVFAGTIHRDLLALERFGVVEPFITMKPQTGTRHLFRKWRLRDDSIRSLIYRRAAELRCELRDCG